MKRDRAKKKKKKNLSWIFIPVTFVLLVAAVCVFLYFMKVERIEVAGNYYTNRDTVERLVFTSEDDYRLYRVLKTQLFGAGESEIFSDVKVELTGIQSARITVKETEAVCQMLLGDTHVFLNQNGIVLGEGAGNVDKLMNIQGFTILSVTESEPLAVNDRAILLEGIRVILALVKEKVPAETVVYEGNGRFQAKIGNVTAELGTTDHLIEKAAELAGQIPAFRGLSGIMHLENYSEEDRKTGFYFEVVPKTGN